MTEQEKRILSEYAPEEQKQITERLHTLSGVAQFIGKDFSMPVRLNNPGGGWSWDFVKNETFADPDDLLKKPLEQNRFVIAHEGAHRRISPTDMPEAEREQPGYMFMLNCIEDPRVNNFLLGNYPVIRNGMMDRYRKKDNDFENKVKKIEEKKTSVKLRSTQAGREYIYQWSRQAEGLPFELREELDSQAKEVVTKTFADASDIWWTYPMLDEIDRPGGKEVINQYAQSMLRGAKEKIWPEFKKLMDDDTENLKGEKALEDAINDALNGDSEAAEKLKDSLPEEQQKELEELLEQAAENKKKRKEKEGSERPGEGEKGKSQEEPDESVSPDSATEGESSEEKAEDLSEGEKGEESPDINELLDYSTVSDELKEAIKKYIKGLPQEVQDELEKAARAILKEIEEAINKELEGRLIPHEEGDTPVESLKQEDRDTSAEALKEVMEQMDMFNTKYERARSELLPIIDKLEQDLRDIFVARQASGWKNGFKRGKRIDIGKRIQEKAKGVSAMESRAWEQREKPQAKDYAISLLLDLSGSMVGQDKIQEAFKGVVVLMEVLNRLSIKVEVLGFHNRIREYQRFGESFTQEARAKLGDVFYEVKSPNARFNDDGWAVVESVERLRKQREIEKFLMVISDGMPVPSREHAGSEFELESVINTIVQQKDVKLVGLGLGHGTDHVKHYYPHSLANVDVSQMAEALAGLLKDMIENYENY